MLEDGRGVAVGFLRGGRAIFSRACPRRSVSGCNPTPRPNSMYNPVMSLREALYTVCGECEILLAVNEGRQAAARVHRPMWQRSIAGHQDSRKIITCAGLPQRVHYPTKVFCEQTHPFPPWRQTRILSPRPSPAMPRLRPGHLCPDRPVQPPLHQHVFGFSDN